MIIYCERNEFQLHSIIIVKLTRSVSFLEPSQRYGFKKQNEESDQYSKLSRIPSKLISPWYFETSALLLTLLRGQQCSFRIISRTHGCNEHVDGQSQDGLRYDFIKWGSVFYKRSSLRFRGKE